MYSIRLILTTEMNEEELEALWNGPYMLPLGIDFHLAYIFHDFVDWRHNSYQCIEANLHLINAIPGMQSIVCRNVEFLYDATRQIAVCCDLAYHVGME